MAVCQMLRARLVSFGLTPPFALLIILPLAVALVMAPSPVRSSEPGRPSSVILPGAHPKPLVIPGLSGPGVRHGGSGVPLRGSAAETEQQGMTSLPPSLTTVRVNYLVVEQPLSAALVELAALANLSLVIDGRLDAMLVQASLTGQLQDVLDDLSRRHGFEWSLTSGTIEITPSDGVVSRSIKTTGLTDERIASLLAAAGIEDARGRITFDPATQVLRIRGAPRFVARAEAAILVVAEKEDSINVVRFGRTSRVVGP